MIWAIVVGALLGAALTDIGRAILLGVAVWGFVVWVSSIFS